MDGHPQKPHHQGHHHQAAADAEHARSQSRHPSHGGKARQVGGGFDPILGEAMGLDGGCQYGVHQRLQGQQLPALHPQAHPAEQARTEAGPNGNRQGGAPGKAAIGQVRPGGPESGGHDRQGAGGECLVRFQPRQ